MNTRDNLFYTKLRDELEKKQARINFVKQREMEQANEKMYGKLVHILNSESRAVSKTRNQPHESMGTLNVAVRRESIRKINKDNEAFSKRLSAAVCTVPKVEDIRKRTEKLARFKSAVSNRNEDGTAKRDPLIMKKAQFELATA